MTAHQYELVYYFLQNILLVKYDFQTTKAIWFMFVCFQHFALINTRSPASVSPRGSLYSIVLHLSLGQPYYATAKSCSENIQ